MRVAAIQFDIIAGDVEGNRAKAEQYLRQAAAEGAELALLPGLWNCGYILPELERVAETLQGPTVRFLQKLAAELKMYIVGGSIAELRDGNYYNTSVLVDPNGDMLKKYRKAHLFKLGLHEKDYFTAGNDWALWDLPQIRLGMTICYDLRFPEMNRNLSLRGARLFTCPTQWPTSRVEDMHLFLRVRAMENHSFYINANACGYDAYNQLQYPGRSTIVSPLGKVILEASADPGAYVADLDFELLEKAKHIDVFADRRRILDEIDDNML